MWDSGIGICVGCGVESDRDAAGRCESCFRKGVSFKQPVLKTMVHLAGNDYASEAHIRDIRSRRLDTKTGKMYYEKGKTLYFH